VILGQNEWSAVEQIAQEAGIDGNPEELGSNALNAIVNGHVDEVAYRVTEAAGVVWITPFVWYRKEKALNAELARRIIEQAKSDETYEGPLPDDDEKAISEAKKLVDMAQEAWDNSVHGPQVEAILRIAAQGNGETPADSQKKETETPPPTEEGGPDPHMEDPEKLAEEEPWEGYGGEKVGDIIEAIGIALEDEDEPDDEKDALLAHVWAYESAHKKRTRILKHLEKIGEERAPAEEKPPAEKKGEGEASDSAASDASAGGKEGSEGSEGDGKEAGDADDGESKSVRGDEPERKAPGEGEEDRPGEDEAEASAQDSDSYRGLIEDARAEVVTMRLHSPSPDEWKRDEIEDLPRDLSKLSDADLQRLYGQFAALAYYANFLLMVEEASERRCRQALTEMTNELLVAADKYDSHDKAKTMTILEAEVGQDPEVKQWKRRVNKHAAFAAVHRQERDSYNKLVESLSRLETMRDNEFQRAGGSKRKR
jgi:hypothetical protein